MSFSCQFPSSWLFPNTILSSASQVRNLACIWWGTSVFCFVLASYTFETSLESSEIRSCTTWLSLLWTNSKSYTVQTVIYKLCFCNNVILLPDGTIGLLVVFIPEDFTWWMWHSMQQCPCFHLQYSIFCWVGLATEQLCWHLCCLQFIPFMLKLWAECLFI
jgi:hypothetical protein